VAHALSALDSAAARPPPPPATKPAPPPPQQHKRPAAAAAARARPITKVAKTAPPVVSSVKALVLGSAAGAGGGGGGAAPPSDPLAMIGLGSKPTPVDTASATASAPAGMSTPRHATLLVERCEGPLCGFQPHVTSALKGRAALARRLFPKLR